MEDSEFATPLLLNLLASSEMMSRVRLEASNVVVGEIVILAVMRRDNPSRGPNVGSYVRCISACDKHLATPAENKCGSGELTLGAREVSGLPKIWQLVSSMAIPYLLRVDLTRYQ